jgi:hypothetical protein
LLGKPSPSVKWYKEGKELEQTSDEITITYESSTGVATLTIRQVTFKDSAKYTCVARNALGSCSTTAMINVQGIYMLEKWLEKYILHNIVFHFLLFWHGFYF